MSDFTNSSTIYISATEGSDAYTGLAPHPGKGASGPLRSFRRLRELLVGLHTPAHIQPITVRIEGEHYFNETFVLGAISGGYTMRDITFESYGDAPARLVGGRRIEGFAPDTFNGVPCLSVHIPTVESGAWHFTDLYVNGKRAAAARYPREGTLRAVAVERMDAQKLGDGSKWFFAYLDYRWPTIINENGEKELGLLDTLVHEIKNGRLRGYHTDKATDPNNLFNKIVKEVTGYDCMEDIRKKYAEEFKSGAWDFKGFRDYDGNFVVENLPGVPNPQYPMIADKNPGDKTAAKLETPVTEGTNLALGATIHKVSGEENSKELGSMLVDGNLKTKWCCTSGAASDKTYSLDGAKQWIVLDLGEKKTFNTYTIYNTKTQETGGNTTEWEILLSDDTKTWVSVDYQPDCNDNIVSFNIGTQSARYILLKGYTVDTGAGTIRLYEFQLYNQQ